MLEIDEEGSHAQRGQKWAIGTVFLIINIFNLIFYIFAYYYDTLRGCAHDTPASPTPLACKREPGVGVFILHIPNTQPHPPWRLLAVAWLVELHEKLWGQ